MYVATMQYLNNKRKESKDTQFAVYISDTHVPLKQSHGHQS